MFLCTSEEMRKIDQITIEERAVPGITLMEQAGKAVVELIEEKLAPKNITIAAGKGNNAGDGFVVARLLAEKNYSVRLVMLGKAEDLKGDALTNYERLPENVIRKFPSSIEECAEDFASCDLIVDAILGTGIKGAPKDLIADVIDKINLSGKPVIAIDIPSGLSGSGEYPEGPVVKAHFTVTMGLSKLGMEIFPGVEYCGEVTIAPLSFPAELLASSSLKYKLTDIEMVREYFPEREPDGNKHTFGFALIAAGSAGMSGAAILSGTAALRSGAGLVYMAVPRDVLPAIEANLIEAVKIPADTNKSGRFDNHSISRILEASEKVDAVAIGPGIGAHPDTYDMARELVKKINKPLVIDADGINAIAEKPRLLLKRKAPAVITPHPGEMARLMDVSTETIQKDRISYAKKFAGDYGVITVLKGARTIIASPDGEVFINPTGNTSLAKGGSGDVLTGLITGLIAQGISPLHAAVAGVYIHGLSAEMASDEMNVRFILPSDIINYFSLAFDYIAE